MVSKSMVRDPVISAGSSRECLDMILADPTQAELILLLLVYQCQLNMQSAASKRKRNDTGKPKR
jgi:hypothetical protein